MEFKLDAGQKMLQNSAREFLKKEFSSEVVNDIINSDTGYSPKLWKKMSKLGWMGLTILEEYGGEGGSFLDVMILLEEMGYNLCPSPYFTNTILSVIFLLTHGDERQKKKFLPSIASGKKIFSFAFLEEDFDNDPASISFTALKRNGGYCLQGTKMFVPYAHISDYILCVARTREKSRSEQGISVFLVETKSAELDCRPLRSLSLERLCEVQFKNIIVSQENIIGVQDTAWPSVHSTIMKAALCLSAQMIGGARAVLDMSLSYAKERRQFKRPIGSFQAIQQYLVDMWLNIYATHHLVYKTAWKIQQAQPAEKEIAVAKSRAGEVYRRTTSLGHQIFGATGFTKEIDMHLYHRDAISSYLSFGDSNFHKEILARELGM